VDNFNDGTMPHLAGLLLGTMPIHIGQWQSKDTSKIPQMATFELTDITFRMDVPGSQEELVKVLGDDLNGDWAEAHFLERIGGVPVNPPPSHTMWPWARHNANHQEGPALEFSHTYPERMWPRYAGRAMALPNRGIRFDYGDLQDVVNLLVQFPLTRQAYLPIWFPEDTGVSHRQRVPCSLGYHFMVRNGVMSCRYYMRSCDLIRHFTDDVYMAARLLQWVVQQVNWKNADMEDDSPTCPNPWHDSAPARARGIALCRECPPGIGPGELVMHIASLHAFVGDQYKLDQLVKRGLYREP
jgi:hypothetical protein